MTYIPREIKLVGLALTLTTSLFADNITQKIDYVWRHAIEAPITIRYAKNRIAVIRGSKEPKQLEIDYDSQFPALLLIHRSTKYSP